MSIVCYLAMTLGAHLVEEVTGVFARVAAHAQLDC